MKIKIKIEMFKDYVKNRNIIIENNIAYLLAVDEYVMEKSALGYNQEQISQGLEEE